MSKAHLPPVPPANRAPHGGGAAPSPEGDIAAEKAEAVKDSNLASQGRQGNSAANTRNQGYQQDR
jgi:hypothetical protein